MTKFYRYNHKFWSRLFPELMLYEDKDDQEKAYRTVMKSITWRGLLLLPFFVITAVFVFRPIVGIVGGYFTFVADLNIWLPLPTLMLAILGPQATIWVFRHTIRHDLRVALNVHGIPVCMSCGYCLRGLKERRCPECGCAWQDDGVKDEDSNCDEG